MHVLCASVSPTLCIYTMHACTPSLCRSASFLPTWSSAAPPPPPAAHTTIRVPDPWNVHRVGRTMPTQQQRRALFQKPISAPRSASEAISAISAISTPDAISAPRSASQAGALPPTSERAAVLFSLTLTLTLSLTLTLTLSQSQSLTLTSHLSP